MDETTIITGGRLIDGRAAAPVEDAAVVVRDGHVVQVGAAGEVDRPKGARHIDAAGRTIMPGLIEGHAHIPGTPAGVQWLRLSLQRGITTVANVSANLRGIEMRDGIAAGQLRGCSRIVAGCIVTPTHGHVRFRTADGPWEVRRAVREMAEAGADFIKTAASGGFYSPNESCSSPNYTLEELTALVEEAHAWGLPVVCHVHTQPGLGYCIETGVDQIHHGAFIDEAAVKGIAAKQLVYTPTLTVTSQRNIRGLADQPWQTVEMQKAQPVHRAGVRLARELGVRLAVGCDYPGNPRSWRIGDRTMVELQELVACGLTAMEAISAATAVNAAAYGKQSELGTLEPGKRADLVVVDGNPAEDIAALYPPENILLVMKDGRVDYARGALREHYRVEDDQPPDRMDVVE